MQPTPTGQTPRSLAHELLARGRIALLLDLLHAGHSGLPAKMTSHILRLDVLDAHDRVDFSGMDHLLVHYLDNETPAIAKLAWDAVFVVVGQIVPGKIGPNVRPGALPACFEPDRQANVMRLLNQLGLGTARPGAIEWKLEITPAILAADGDRSAWRPEKLEALQTLLDAGPAILLLDLAAPGLSVPPQLRQSGQSEVAIGKNAPWRDVVMTRHIVAWSQLHEGATLRFSVPWAAIGAMQSPQTGLGWWWPRDLPAPGRAQLENNQDIWPALSRLDGIPLGTPAPVPLTDIQVLTLQPPPPASKQSAIETGLRLGLVVVLIDALHPAIRLPPSMPGRARVLLVPLGLPNLDAKVRFSDEGFSAVMPDFNGQKVNVAIPWQAVFLVSPMDGSRVGTWPDDYPPTIVNALHALRSVQFSDGGEVPAEMDVLDRQPNGDGLGLGLHRAPDGGFNLVVSQPLGFLQQLPPGLPPGAQARAMMELSFRLPAPGLQ